MSKQIISDMFENVVHVGHRAQKWNPLMKKYLYGEHEGIHIINLEETVKHFQIALKFMSRLVKDGKTILFVSTKPQSVKLLKQVAQDSKMPFVVSKWIPGLLTNFDTIKARIKYLADLKEQEACGDFDKYTKKEAISLKKTIDKLQLALGGVEQVKSLPDAVFVVDVVRDAIVVKEARRLRIPVIGIVDSNADPTSVDYPIPANDDAIMSLRFLLGMISETISKGPKKSTK